MSPTGVLSGEVDKERLHFERGWGEALQVDFDCLPGARSVLDGNLDTDCIRLFHVPNLGLESKAELIKTKAQSFRQHLQAACPGPFHPQIQVLCGASPLRKA